MERTIRVKGNTSEVTQAAKANPEEEIIKDLKTKEEEDVRNGTKRGQEENE